MTIIEQREGRDIQLLGSSVTNFNRRILGVFGPQFKTVNNKHIVKTDSNVRDIQFGWFKDIVW